MYIQHMYIEIAVWLLSGLCYRCGSWQVSYECEISGKSLPGVNVWEMNYGKWVKF